MSLKHGTKHRNVPWQAPASIVFSLITGTLLATGYHLFYSSLEGTQASSHYHNVLGLDLSTQQINVAIGTAFAILSKAVLITVVSSAYLQLLWRRLMRGMRRTTLHDLDVAFSGLNTITALFKVRVWRRYSLLFGLAIAAWYIGFVAAI